MSCLVAVASQQFKVGLVVFRVDSIFCVGYSSGRFGACFLPALCKQSDLQVFAARPGLRLWRSDIRGQVEDTRLLKPLFNSQVHWEHWSHMIQILFLVLLPMLLLLYLVLGERQLYLVFGLEDILLFPLI